MRAAAPAAGHGVTAAVAASAPSGPAVAVVPRSCGGAGAVMWAARATGSCLRAAAATPAHAPLLAARLARHDASGGSAFCCWSARPAVVAAAAAAASTATTTTRSRSRASSSRAVDDDGAAAAAKASSGRGRGGRSGSSARSSSRSSKGSSGAPATTTAATLPPPPPQPAAAPVDTLMIVESPAKAAKLAKFLGPGYRVLASYGHVRDLARRAGSVRPDDGFALDWEVTGAAAEARLREIAAAARGARRLLLATDPDREGEAIAWHLAEELKRRGALPRPGLDVRRVAFNEVTQRAVADAIARPRDVAAPLVDAYLARRALDYLVGFTLSPLLWRRLGPAARSAGRVQSVALRLVSEREDEVQLFASEEFWSVGAEFAVAGTATSSSSSGSSSNGAAAAAAEAAAGGGGEVGGGALLAARLVAVDGERLAQMALRTAAEADALVARLWQRPPPPPAAATAVGSDEGQPPQAQVAAAAPAASDTTTSAAADALAELRQPLRALPGEEGSVIYTVARVTKRPVRRNPPPPFVTSTLQQEAARRLGFSATRTMRVAQQLYEGADSAAGEGLITYMRTDGVNVAAEAAEALRDVARERFGGDAAVPPGGPRAYRSRAKNAQEAHEAIRPTDPRLAPADAARQLAPDQAKLYALIWRRAVASQMQPAALERVTAELASPCGALLLRASGSSLASPGFLAAWAGFSPGAGAAAGAAADDDDEEGGGGLPEMGAAASGDEDDDDDAGADGGGAGSRRAHVDDLALADAVAGGGGGGGGLSPAARLSALLASLSPGQRLPLVAALPARHATKPPPRYSEASMVKTLEQLGIGRPSTYAPILKLLQDRGYVARGAGRALVPTPLGRLLSAYLTAYFPAYVDTGFSARVEAQLDDVSGGALAWRELLRGFWAPLRAAADAAAKASTTAVFDELERRLAPLIFAAAPDAHAALPAGATAADSSSATQAEQQHHHQQQQQQHNPRVCPACGGRLVLKPSRATGGFIACKNHATTGCTFGRPLWPDADEQLALSDEEEGVAAAAAAAAAAAGGGSSGGGGGGGGTAALPALGASKLLGRHPDGGLPVWLKRGPYGLYVQLGPPEEVQPPPSSTDPAAAAAEAAAAAGDAAGGNGDGGGEPGDATNKQKKQTKKQRPSKPPPPPRATLPKALTWASATLADALELLRPPRAVGPHPDDGEPIVAAEGRYGAFVRHRTLFAPLPAGVTPGDVTLEEAVALVEAKASRLRARGRDPYAAGGGRGGAAAAAAKKKKKGGGGWLLFLRETKAGGGAANAEAGGGDSVEEEAAAGAGGGGSRLKQAAAAWRALSDEQRAGYAARAAQLAASEAPPAAADGTSSRRSSSRSRGSSSSSSSSSSRSSRSSRSSTAPSAGGRRSCSTAATAAAAQHADNGSSNNSSSDGSGRGKRARPARPLSPYHLFQRQQRGDVVAANPGAAPTMVIKLLAERWRALGPDGQAAFAAAASGAQQQQQQQQAESAAAQAEAVGV